MKRLSPFLLVLIILSMATQAQHTNIMIDDTGSWMQPEEPSIIVNPKNTDHMVGGKHTRVFEPEENSLSTGMYYFALESGNYLMKKKMIFVK